MGAQPCRFTTPSLSRNHGSTSSGSTEGRIALHVRPQRGAAPPAPRRGPGRCRRRGAAARPAPCASASASGSPARARTAPMRTSSEKSSSMARSAASRPVAVGALVVLVDPGQQRQLLLRVAHVDGGEAGQLRHHGVEHLGRRGHRGQRPQAPGDAALLLAEELGDGGDGVAPGVDQVAVDRLLLLLVGDARVGQQREAQAERPGAPPASPARPAGRCPSAGSRAGRTSPSPCGPASSAAPAPARRRSQTDRRCPSSLPPLQGPRGRRVVVLQRDARPWIALVERLERLDGLARAASLGSGSTSLTTA